MNDSWRDGDRNPRSFSPGRGASRGFGSRGRGRSVHRGSINQDWRSSTSQDRRGAKSFDSLYTPPPRENTDTDEFSRPRGGRGRGDGRGRARSHRREREYPTGFKELERLLSSPSDVIALELLREQSGYQLLLKEDSMKDEKFLLLIQVLSHATNTKSNKESLYELFNMTCEPGFMNKLCSFSMNVRRKHLDKAKSFFTHLIEFLHAYSNAMINIAIDRVPDVIEACLMNLMHLKSQAFVSQELIDRYESLQAMLTEATERWEEEKRSSSRKRPQNGMDDMEPPDDFRLMSVLPTAQDLVNNNRPFLRKNIVEGKYKDEIHYLDVQFRLLREDFVKPLRTGISDFKGDVKSRFKDIRIYRGVTVVGTMFNNRKMMHLLKLNLPRHIKSIENSKRLLYGNLLCLSSDNFRTLIFASVSERNTELYQKEGVIGIQFESDIEDVDFSTRFVMAESRAYFMAYKHVLKALQEMADNGVALAPYIIHVRSNVDPPNYLGLGEKYDLRVIKGIHYMRKEEARNKLFEFEDDTEELDPDLMPHLKEVFIQRDLISWPSESDLGMDSSQRRAFRSALTKQLAIIQGPPGTGKTFLGLKVTQTLLHNSSAWKDHDHPTPILVVCFTNHALDQFLEGMTPYTKNIVRVGSRTKSESISRFQVNTLVRSLHGTRGIPRAIHDMNTNLRFQVMELEGQIKRMRTLVDACRRMDGIMMLDNFSGQNIIPPNLENQLSRVGLGHWLLLSVNPEAVGKIENRKKAAKPNLKPSRGTVTYDNAAENQNPLKDNVEEGKDDEEDFKDAEEFLAQEEQDRLLVDDEDDDCEKDLKTYTVEYEVTATQLEHYMDEAYADMMLNENNFEAAFKHNILSGQSEALKIGLELPLDMGAADHLEKDLYLNLMRLDFPSRWLLYKSWTKKLEDNILKDLSKLESKYQRKSRAVEEVKNQEFLYLMRHASVVGMTTTGAAQYSSIMQDLAPSIVIIEEAAEILESHVITALTSKCQHLIMIGDHQQLRPSATVFELATKYGLDTSLFERMIKNGLAYETLEYQHRMRPSISRLLVPSIYPKLKDHPVVSTYPHVKGVVKDIFFISHDIPEREESDDNNSHENEHEAEFLMGLCKHLMLQGYKSSQVTILTPYSGQFFLLRKLQRDHTVCQGVKICVVDNFQGEENDIILLSLVRSNEEGKVGFLRTDNRVCVALSRAKHGLYITGNMALLSGSSNLWKKIQNDLMEDNCFGNSLTLKCENHSDQLISVTKGEEFKFKSPEGGCLQTCNKGLPNCSHTCPKVCHMDDREHTNFKCRVPCPKILCDLEHQCPKLCFEVCGPCKMPVDKLCPCGHTNIIACHVDPENFLCKETVERVLDNCQHTVKMPCYCDTKTFPCPLKCDTRLDCGHQCRQLCHRKRDPDHLHYDCKQPCTKLNAGCTQNHQCQRLCFEDCGNCIVLVKKKLPCGHEAQGVECHSDPAKINCKKNCKRTLSCGHACKKLCYKPCDPCPVKVKKAVPECKHIVLVECGLPPTIDLCDGKCTKTLSCGHACLEKCKEPCTTKCKELVITPTKCPKNHVIKMPCHLVDKVTGEDAWQYCDEPCKMQLNCDHQCMGNCGGCFQGRLHMSCKKPCKKTLVCGHICNSPCSADCPPCQANCNWKCLHSRCRKKCGIPCSFCKEKCTWKCEHQRCNKLCGQRCSVAPCQKPCPEKLKCGHPCIGFCGDPCPPLCRICNQEDLIEFILLGFEEDADSRFVLLEDCGHSIEAEGLEGWLAQDNGEIGMKTCPRCRKPIYNNRRYQHIILDTYKDVSKVKSKYFTSKEIVRRKDIELLLQDVDLAAHFPFEVEKILKVIGFSPNRRSKAKQKFCSDVELKLYMFQVRVLKKACHVLKNSTEQEQTEQVQNPPPRYLRFGLQPRVKRVSSKHEVRLRPRVKELVDMVMEKTIIIAAQMEEEICCELQRLMILPSYWTFLEKVSTNTNDQLQEIGLKIENLMDPTVKFCDETDKKVRALLKESEKYIGGLGISDSEKVMIVRAMGLKQGHWYKCPKGHVYCITECGGAMVESNCPECGSRIGGAAHTLRSDNAVATEMDGSRHGAWSEHNNMANFHIYDL